MPGEENSFVDPADSDTAWHVMDVPNFWQPVRWWISQSISKKHWDSELNRVHNRYTFDAENTRNGCYRNWIIVPKSMSGKRVFVAFDGAATLAEVFWNGHKVGSHVGMFGRFKCDVTKYVKFGGRNLLAVKLSTGSNGSKDDDKVVGVAVTVTVTKSMLEWFPHGAFGAMGSSTPVAYGGLWQPVKLIFTGKSSIEHVYFTPKLDSASILTEISGKVPNAVLQQSLIPKGGTKSIWSSAKHIDLSGGNIKVDTLTAKLHPNLWSPEHPNLYILNTKIVSSGKIIDQVKTQVGFRTFEVKNSKFYLNGKPYWLRGADMPPYGMAPNNAKLAHKFMKYMHDGNEMATRSHCSPYNETWQTAADEEGVAVSSEGIWPWALMGPIPNKTLLDHWKKEQLEVVRDLYNHPSLIINTIGNEVMQGCCNDVDKWKIMSSIVKSVRNADPTRPIVFSSEMTRAHYADLWKNTLSKEGYDSGDIDDVHCYYGWYQPSMMMLDFNSPIPSQRFTPTPGRLFMSQEGGTGYPSVDDGFGTELYNNTFKMPQAWAGKYALPESGSSDIYLQVLADINKLTAEKVRVQRKYWAGYMLFNNLCWFKNCYDDKTIEPYKIYDYVKLAYSPVLIALESPQRHIYAGDTLDSRVCITNDDIGLPVAKSLKLYCWVEDESGAKIGDTFTTDLADCPYYGQIWKTISIKMPSLDGRDDAVLHMKLESAGKIISENKYDIVICSHKWADADYNSAKNVIVLNGNCSEQQFNDAKDAAVKGATVLWLDAAENAGKFMPDVIESVQNFKGEFVDMDNPKNEIFSGFKPLDWRWWYSKDCLPSVTDIQYTLKKGSGAKSYTTFIMPHMYMSEKDVKKLPHSTIFEVPCGSGRIIVSSMRTQAAGSDPIAARLISNLYRYASDEK